MRNRGSHKDRRQAFSLLEMAVVLGIIGVVSGGFLVAVSAQDEQAKINRTISALDSIEEALIAFYQINGRLPCPARKDLADSNAAFGLEWNSGGPCLGNPTEAQINEVHDGTNEEVWVGAIPIRTLGLPATLAYDGWGSRLSYALVNRLGQSALTFRGYASAAPTRDLTIIDAEGSFTGAPDTSDATIVNNKLNDGQSVAYVLVSHGKDKRGGYNKSGVVGIACDTAGTVPRDTENCDYAVGASVDAQKTTFRDMRIVDSASGTATFYYDYIRWKTLPNFGFKTYTISTGSGRSGGITLPTLPVCPANSYIAYSTALSLWQCDAPGGGWNAAGTTYTPTTSAVGYTTITTVYPNSLLYLNVTANRATDYELRVVGDTGTGNAGFINTSEVSSGAVDGTMFDGSTIRTNGAGQFELGVDDATATNWTITVVGYAD